MTQINNIVYYDSNSEDNDNEDTFHNNIEGEVVDEFDAELENTIDDVHRKPINN